MGTVFWCITVPGIYLAGMLFTYWACRKLEKRNGYDSDEDDEDIREVALVWPISVPVILIVTIFILLYWLMDVIGGKHD